MDWCSYAIECLDYTILEWKINQQYNGPIAMLLMLYKYTHDKRHAKKSIQTPAIGYITSESLTELEKSLYKNEPITDDDLDDEDGGDEEKGNNESEKESGDQQGEEEVGDENGEEEVGDEEIGEGEGEEEVGDEKCEEEDNGYDEEVYSAEDK